MRRGALIAALIALGVVLWLVARAGRGLREVSREASRSRSGRALDSAVPDERPEAEDRLDAEGKAKRDAARGSSHARVERHAITIQVVDENGAGVAGAEVLV